MVGWFIPLTGAVALAEYLADNCYLMRLDLRENDIRTGGMMALSLSLNVNTILLRLDLDKDVKKESVSFPCLFLFHSGWSFINIYVSY